MAYLKEWAPRAHNDLALRLPDVLPRAAHGKGRATCLDADEAARARGGRRLPRPALQPALVPGQLPRLGIAGALGQARGVRGGVQASGREAAEKRLQLAPRIRGVAAPAAVRGPRADAGCLVQQRGIPAARCDGGDALVAGGRPGVGCHDREGRPALRRRADRDLQSAGAEGGHGEPPQEHRVPVRRVTRRPCTGERSVRGAHPLQAIISIGSSPGAP